MKLINTVVRLQKIIRGYKLDYWNEMLNFLGIEFQKHFL